jgi:hypothetical protein
LRLFPIDAREMAGALRIVERLRAGRRVDGDGPWTVVYRGLDTTQAM